ncbi:MAG: type 1 glutamine amidotransferase [Desulfobacterales bacterium]|jgi:GMP synthase (glutamine-hydrolysing)
MHKSEQKRRATASVTIIQHIYCETPGIIADCLQSAGIDMHFIRIFDGNPIPSNLDTQAGLIVMGGPMSVYDHGRFPFLLEEQRLIEQVLKEDKPLLGICLGSQLIAATLGAEVKSGGQKEIGWYPVSLTASAATDALWKGLPSSFTAYHWHGDVYDLPQGAVSLAASELTPCQGFRYGKKAYGFLFHMEVTEKIIGNMVKEFRGELDAESITAESIIATSKGHLEELQTIGGRVFGRWVKLLDAG